MIKNHRKFFKEDEKRRIDYLHNLSIKKSAHILEEILSSHLMVKLNFIDDDRPVALSKLVVEHKQCQR